VRAQEKAIKPAQQAIPSTELEEVRVKGTRPTQQAYEASKVLEREGPCKLPRSLLGFFAGPSPGQQQSPRPLLLSTAQFRRCKAEKIFAMQIFPPEQPQVVGEQTPMEGVLLTGLPKAAPECVPVLQRYTDVFEPLPPGLPPDRGVGHVIPLVGDGQPPRKRPFRLSPREKEEAERQVAWLLEQGWVEPSTSPYGSTILFKEKKDGDLRMCIDYRALNQLTVKNRYPLPRIDDLLDSLHGAKVFSSLDLQHGYHQIRIQDEDVPKTAFITHKGLFQYKVLCFGLCNAPGTFQAVMNKVLAPVLGKCAVVYMDDILVYSNSMEGHKRDLAQVLDLLRAAQMKCKLSKCSFGMPETKFLGFLVTEVGISVDPQKVKVLLEWSTPTAAREVQSFLGLATYFRRFCPGFAKVARPLHRLTHKATVFAWTAEAQNAFDSVKRMLTTAPVLMIPDMSKTAPLFVVHCDASDYAIGAVLTQGGKPIAYESRMLQSAEVNYSTGEKELLAVVHAMRTWRCFLEGGKTEVMTDHNPITFLQIQKVLSRRQARWSEYLQNFDIKWVYRAGVRNPADGLSRLRTGPTEEVPNVQLGLLLLVQRTLTKQRAGQRVTRTKLTKQPHMRSVPSILQRCREGYERDPWVQRNAQKLKDWFLLDGLYRKDGQQGGPVLVPEVDTLRTEILSEIHDTPYGGHLGVARTLEQLQRMFVWPGCTTDVKQFVSTCHTCQRDKIPRSGPAGLMQPLAVPGRRWESVSMDFITQLPKTGDGNESIVVFVDRLTKMVHLAALAGSATAAEVARCFIHNVFRLHGLPRNLVSDRDARFTGRFWVEITRILGTKRSMSTAYHPQSDGQTERTNATLEDMLRHWVGPQLDDWDQALDCAEFAINNAKSESVQDTPFRLNYGQDPLTPLSIEAETDVPSAADFVSKIAEATRRAKTALVAARARQKAYYDRGRRDIEFRPGQQVLLKTTNIHFAQGKGRKLLPKWIGPYPVLSKVGRLAYRLDLPPHLRMHPVFHVSLLRLFQEGTRQQKPPPPVEVQGELEWEVEKVLGERGTKNRKQFLVQWKGYGPEDTSWQPAKNLAAAQEAIRDFRQSKRDPV
jgi:hypothetical protein